MELYLHFLEGADPRQSLTTPISWDNYSYEIQKNSRRKIDRNTH